MASEFTVKQAKQLIEQHKMLLADLERMTAKANGIQTDIQRSVARLVAQSVLKRIILNDCVSATPVSVMGTEIDMLCHSVYQYEMAHADIETVKEFRIYAERYVRPAMARLNPGLGGLTWFFGGKRAKENAAAAYRELQQILSDSYGQMIPHLAAVMDTVTETRIDTACQAFRTNPRPFAAVLETLFPEVFFSKQNNPFQPVLAKLHTVEQKSAALQAATEREKEAIRKAAERMMATDALQILRGIPVEEVNRVQSGYRVKTLRDAGYATMADIYLASGYQLEALNGISENAAHGLQRIAKQFLKEIQDGVKIKLSADDRNKAATELLKAIYIHLQSNQAAREQKDIIRSYEAKLPYAKSALDAVGNGLPWLFYLPKQQEEVRQSYQSIVSAAEGEYAEAVSKLHLALSVSKTAPADDAVWQDFIQHNAEYYAVLDEIVPGALGNGDGLYGLPEELAREIQEEAFFPDGLNCKLRRYQEWGVKYILHQKKVLLGDEMGLGKTVQAIAAMVSLRNTGATHFMVICPASVVTNWCREIQTHSKLSVTKVHGAGRMQALRSWSKTGGVAVTTYETTAYFKEDDITRLDMITVDEAHYIKNPEARRSINVKSLCGKSERLLFMTGTALENRVEEMVSLIEVLQPNVAASVQGMTYLSNAPQFRNCVAPVYYRRKREDVLTELPELIETKEWCTMFPEEKDIYERSVLSKNYSAARRLSWNAEDPEKSCKVQRLHELIREAEAEERKILVFSFFLDTIRTAGSLRDVQFYGPINGSVPPHRRQEIIDEFDKAPAGSVLLAQIQSGGTGLNIQSASVVVICEPQLKPSIENQAISRAYRMGQARNVLVYRLLCENSIDEKITKLLEEKQKIFDAFADQSVAAQQHESYNTEVDETALGQLIQEEIDRINAEKEGGTAAKTD